MKFENAELTFSPQEEQELRRKFDLNILPPLMLMCLFSTLDKGNVANAKTDRWDKDIGLTGNQYYILVMVYYVPLCLFGTPISLLVKRFSAALLLPCLMMGFGILSVLTGFATRFSHVLAIRFFLGTFESGVLPGVIFYLTTFYKRSELASRIALFYGLIAFGVFQIGHIKFHGWQFLFWIEGGSTIVFALLALLWLPRSPSYWGRLTEREKAISKARILADSSVSIDEPLNIRDAFRPLRSPMYWIWALISLSLGIPLISIGNFLPLIVASLGYSTVKTNLYTVAPSIVGTAFLFLFTFSSDYFRERSMHICVCLAINLTGFIVLSCIDPAAQKDIAYFACFLLTVGIFPISTLVGAWYSNNTLNESHRLAITGVMVSIACSAGLISTNVFRAEDEPKYVLALATSAAFGGLCLVLVAGVGIYMRIENRRRNREQSVNLTAAAVNTEDLALGPASPSFRYMY